MKTKWIIACFLLSLLFFPLNAIAAKSFYSDGTVDNSNGLPSKDLIFKDFDIQDGYITGSIINKSDHPLKSVKLDMWTTNRQETRILWRKALIIGDMAPKGKFEVKEPYDHLAEDPLGVVYKFRVPAPTSFRNEKIKK